MIEEREKTIRKGNRPWKRKRTAKPSERWEGGFWQNKQSATNSITFLISGTTSTYGRREGTRTNLTETTMQTNKMSLEAAPILWTQDGFLCAQSHCWLAAIASIIASRTAKWSQKPMNATNNIWQKNRVSVLTPGSSTRRHQQTKTASTKKSPRWPNTQST